MAESLMFQWRKQLLFGNGARQEYDRKKKFALERTNVWHPVYVCKMLNDCDKRHNVKLKIVWWKSVMRNVDWSGYVMHALG